MQIFNEKSAGFNGFKTWSLQIKNSRMEKSTRFVDKNEFKNNGIQLS